MIEQEQKNYLEHYFSIQMQYRYPLFDKNLPQKSQKVENIFHFSL